MALKSKTVSNNWELVSKLFEASLHSAYQQINSDIKIIVVCHETPHLENFYDDRVEIINVDFPPPNELNTKLTMKDKWNKLAVGLVRAGELNPDFMMLMDADDLVSRRLSQFAQSNPNSNGWILNKGYKYRYGSRWIYVDDRYNCGTNAIVNAKLIEFPKNTTPEEIGKCVILTTGHLGIEKTLTDLGTPLTPLPFPGAVQIVGHGDNDSDLWRNQKGRPTLRQFLGKLRRTRWLTPRLRREFGIPIARENQSRNQV